MSIYLTPDIYYDIIILLLKEIAIMSKTTEWVIAQQEAREALGIQEKLSDIERQAAAQVELLQEKLEEKLAIFLSNYSDISYDTALNQVTFVDHTDHYSKTCNVEIDGRDIDYDVPLQGAIAHYEFTAKESQKLYIDSDGEIVDSQDVYFSDLVGLTMEQYIYIEEMLKAIAIWESIANV